MELSGGHVGMGRGREVGVDPDQVYGSDGRGREQTNSIRNPGEMKSQDQSRIS